MRNQTAVLAGAPSAVSGVLPFHNATDTELTITEVSIDETDSTTTLIVPVDRTVVAPGGNARIGVTLTLPPQTAPGEYPLDVTIAEMQVPTTAHVTEARVLGLVPDLLVVENYAGVTARRTMVVANEGNVAVRVPDEVSLPVYREEMALETLRTLASGKLGTRRIAPLPEPVATIDVATDRGARTVAPGEVEAIELLLALPEQLPQHSRFLAAFPISIRTLLIVVVPAGPPPEPA